MLVWPKDQRRPMNRTNITFKDIKYNIHKTSGNTTWCEPQIPHKHTNTHYGELKLLYYHVHPDPVTSCISDTLSSPEPHQKNDATKNTEIKRFE